MDLRILMAKRIDHRGMQSSDAGVDTGIGECEIHAYVDGRLDSRRRRAVEAHLALHPAQAEKANAYTAQIAMLRKSFGGDEPMSRALQALCDRWKAMSARRHGRPCNTVRITKRPQKGGFPRAADRPD